MKVVGLLSGGKDSVFNLLHCVLNGHEPVAVASLGPPEGKDELDSFMYQTVGHSGLRTIAQALGLPFFSHTIRGTAVNVGGEYGSRSGSGKGDGEEAEKKKGEEKDETEDLYELLKKVKDAMPEVEAVAAGAILSNYQRVRVEHVCARLGLTPVAFLWERNQEELLAEMVEAGMESVLVKVAGAGLQVEHLGKTLGEMQPTLHKLNRRYQLHVCGEGGEYETFTVDCPLFKRRVVLDETTTVVSDPNPFSTVAHLHLDRVSLGPPKPDVPEDETSEELQRRVRETVRVGVPAVLEERARGWKEAGEAVEEAFQAEEAVAEEQQRKEEEQVMEEEQRAEPSVRKTDDGWVYFAEVVAEDAAFVEGEIEDEVRACFSRLTNLLEENDASLLSLTHLTVLLSPASSMSLFPRINAVYASYFGTSPPTRACVAVPEGRGEGRWRVKLEGVARLQGEMGGKQGQKGEERKALHVQSLSYWAAANIGPYSQAVKTANRLYIAGQIPLLPSTLTLPPSPSPTASTSFSYHAALSLQHLRRIVDSAVPSWSSAPSSSSSSSFSPQPGRAEGAILWLAPSPSSATFKQRALAAHAIWAASEASYLADQDQDLPYDDAQEKPAPYVAVEAAQLPKGAEVEWQVTWGTPGGAGGDEEEDEAERSEAEEGETWASTAAVSNATSLPVTWQCSQSFPSPSSTSAKQSVFAVLGCSIDEPTPLPVPLSGLDPSDIHSIRAFYRPERFSAPQVRALAARVFPSPSAAQGSQPALSLVPIGRVATVVGNAGVEEHDVAFVVVGGPAARRA
ncbi:hypothetical protein JCM8097_000227 [Rhodosporidiobolus ruineniae]